MAVGVDVAAGSRQPVGERERRVAQRLGQRVAHAHAAEPLEQRAHGARAREARAHQPDQERERQRGDQRRSARRRAGLEPRRRPRRAGISWPRRRRRRPRPVHSTGASARRCTGPKPRQRRTSTTPSPTSRPTAATPDTSTIDGPRPRRCPEISSRLSGQSSQSLSGCAATNSSTAAWPSATAQPRHTSRARAPAATRPVGKATSRCTSGPAHNPPSASPSAMPRQVGLLEPQPAGQLRDPETVVRMAGEEVENGDHALGGRRRPARGFGARHVKTVPKRSKYRTLRRSRTLTGMRTRSSF